MSTTPLTLKVDADEISPSDFLDVVENFIGLLYDAERELSGTRDRVLIWRLTDLRRGSYEIDVEAEPVEDAADIGPQVATTVMRGLPLIQEGIRPEDYTDEMIERVRRMSVHIGTNGTRSIQLRAPSVLETYTITAATAARIEQVVGQGHTSVGAIEGTLEAVSIHGRPYFTVYEAVTGRAVRCFFSLDLRKRILAAMGFKVLVHGNIRRDPLGRPREIANIDKFRRLGTKPTVSPESLVGIFSGMTGSTRDYLAELRGE